jgi:SAM-dependent methyltransferase
MSGSNAGFDARRIKCFERQGYNLIAARYRQAAAGRSALHDAVLDAAALAPGQALLDLASGPAVLAGAAEPRIMPDGIIVAIDLAENILRQAQATYSLPMLAVADAEALPFADAAFNRIVCGLGLMFFPDEQAALAEMLRVLKPGGLLALSVWGEAREVPLIECALACIRRVLPPPKVPRRSIFHLGDPAHLTDVLSLAGFASIVVAPFALEQRFDGAAQYWQAFLDLAGSAAASLARLPQATQDRLAQEVAVELFPYHRGSGYQFSSRVLIAKATKP